MMNSRILAVLAAVTFAVPVAAAEQGDTVSISVPHGDLDLADAKAQRRLETRIRTAIRTICAPPRLDLRAAQRAVECSQLARAQAEAQVRTAVARAANKDYRVATIAGKPEA